MKPDTRNAPLELWRTAGAFIQILFDLFGEPQRIASLRVFETAQRALALTWIRAGEWLVRELLLIEAALLGPLPEPARRAKQTKTREKTPPLRRYHSFNPDDWRVSFQAIPTSRTTKSKSARRFMPRDHYGAWPLAQRCEALLRVYNNPLAYAKRLARRLFAKPARIALLRKHDPDAEYKVGPNGAAAIVAAADKAAGAFDSS